jgi:hypothetical protein
MTTSRDVYDNMRDLSADRGGGHVETKIIDPGHVYAMPQLGVLKRDPYDDSRFQEMRFLKRSGGAIQYEDEWDGLQTQTVMRVLIDRTRYLYNVLPCDESLRAIRHLQNALWEYEARAFRRKIQSLNREQPAHEENILIPFSPMECETHPLGRDGHLSWLESAMLYRVNIGMMDYEPWDEFWATAEGPPLRRDQLTPEQRRITRLYELGIPKVG